MLESRPESGGAAPATGADHHGWVTRPRVCPVSGHGVPQLAEPHDSSHGGQRGGILLGLVAALVLAGVLGAAAASLLGTASLHEVRANYGERAYYLAESGFRYAASVLRDDEPAFWNLDDASVDVPSGGRFTLAMSKLTEDENYDSEDENYDSEYRVAGDQTINSGDDLDINPDAQLAPKNGLFRYQGSWYRYREFNQDDNSLTEIIAAPDNQRLVAGDHVGEDAIEVGGSLPLQSGSVIPATDHVFTYNGEEYTYEQYFGGVLEGIGGGAFPLEVTDGEVLSFPSEFPFTVEDQDPVKFASMIQVESTGEYGGGDLTVRRKVTYWFYDALGYPEEQEETAGFSGEATHDATGDFDANWQGPGASVGAFDYDTDEEAIQVTGVHASRSVASMAYIGRDIYTPDYEVQVKLKLDPNLFDEGPEAYLQGITFRMDGDNKLAQLRGYGVSFVKWDADGDVPETLVPADFGAGGEQEGEPFMALWRTNSRHDGLNHDPELLAWASTPVGARQNNGLFKEWVTLMLRVEEVDVNGDQANRIHVMYGDPEEHIRNDYPLQWPPDDLLDDSNAFNLIEWEGAAGGTELDNGNQTITTAPGELLFNEDTQDMEVGLHAWGDNMEDNAWYDNFAARVASVDTIDFGGGYIPPLQQ